MGMRGRGTYFFLCFSAESGKSAGQPQELHPCGFPALTEKLKIRRIKEVNRITEEQMRRDAAPEVEFEVPKGASPVKAMQEYFGTAATSHEAMPATVDVENTIVIRFK